MTPSGENTDGPSLDPEGDLHSDGAAGSKTIEQLGLIHQLPVDHLNVLQACGSPDSRDVWCPWAPISVPPPPRLLTFPLFQNDAWLMGTSHKFSTMDPVLLAAPGLISGGTKPAPGAEAPAFSTPMS